MFTCSFGLIIKTYLTFLINFQPDINCSCFIRFMLLEENVCATTANPVFFPPSLSLSLSAEFSIKQSFDSTIVINNDILNAMQTNETIFPLRSFQRSLVQCIVDGLKDFAVYVII